MARVTSGTFTAKSSTCRFLTEGESGCAPPPPAELPVCLRCSLSASHGAVCSHRITSRTRVIALRAGTAGADVRDPA